MAIKFYLLSLGLILLSSEKALSQNPTASETYDRSEATDAKFNETPTSFLIFQYKGENERKVLETKIKWSKPENEFADRRQQLNNLSTLTGKKSPDLVEIFLSSDVPGAVFITNNLYCDETEVTNLSWLEYLHYLKKDSSESTFKRMQPDKKLISLVPQDFFAMDITGWLPEYPADEKREFRLDTYLEHPAYRFFPVVGISYQQANAYCKWRSKFVTNLMHQRFPQTSNLSYNYRLPTEAEWELIAGAGFDIQKYPYGIYPVETINYTLKVNPGAVDYLFTKINKPPSKAQLKADIKKFNETSRLLNEEAAFNTKRDLPYFLNFNTPFYGFAYPKNDFGIYNMIGNVAEMVAEVGIAKGGSWQELLENSKIKDRKLYKSPSSDIGFRCVCEVEKIR